MTQRIQYSCNICGINECNTTRIYALTEDTIYTHGNVHEYNLSQDLYSSSFHLCDQCIDRLRHMFQKNDTTKELFQFVCNPQEEEQK